MTLYIELNELGSDKWFDWLLINNISWSNIVSFPMCDGIRIDGVSNLPDIIPSFVRVGK